MFTMQKALAGHITSATPTKPKTPRIKKEAGVKGGSFNAPHILSSALSSLLNETELPRPQIVKQLWVYIKSNELQDPTNKQYILCDEAMMRVFGIKRMSMFKMNALIGDHLMKRSEVIGLESENKNEKMDEDVEAGEMISRNNSATAQTRDEKYIKIKVEKEKGLSKRIVESTDTEDDGSSVDTDD